jgi:formylglycine-generating enzyme required for sulfatase activity
MSDHHVVDITELAILGEQFPLRLMQLGFRLMQVMDEEGRDRVRYVLPPVCEIPAGPFRRGSDPQYHPGIQEIPPCPIVVVVPAFQIGRYPVTVAEYAYAIEAGIVSAPQRIAKMTWQEQQQRPDHPVLCITWLQARAYAEWLAQMTGQSWRLPTETEWEKAARGVDGFIYPWGNQWDTTRANTEDGGPGMTTPVGCYADSGDASPYGAHDMAGNVWEWTSTTYQPYPYLANDGREALDRVAEKVLRGGSRIDDPECARAAYRDRWWPGNSSPYAGGRLVHGRCDKKSICGNV